MNRRYLVVDDNQAFAENLSEILCDTGASVDVATCGDQGLELARRHKYDALVTDMRMPGMNGAELLARVRELDPGLPAVLLSAYSQDDLLRLAKLDGLLAVLSKPDHVFKLLDVLPKARRDGAVVIVEEDPDFAAVLALRLSERGLTCVTVSSVDELSSVVARPFAVLVDAARLSETVAKVKERWPGVPTVTPPPRDPEALTARIEGLYRAPAS